MIIEKGGFDVQFTIPGIADSCSLMLSTNINITSGSAVQNLCAVISRSGTTYSLSIRNPSGVIYDTYNVVSLNPKTVRWCMHNEFISAYVNENWIHTFWFQNVDYPEYEDLTLTLTSSGSTITATNVKVVDLYDWREAIFIDFDSVASNAISSVIQQRPVEIRPTYLGEVKFQYSADDKRDIVELFQKLIINHSKTRDSKPVISDAIVYGPYVEVLTSEESASSYGMITRIIRVPELDTGARRAAQELIKQARQQSVQHSLKIRSDLRIELGDILQCTYVLSATNKSVSFAFVVESINISLKDAEFSMDITGINL